MQTTEFKKLQARWYKKLKETGFKDIEKRLGDELVLTNAAVDVFRNISYSEWAAREAYFAALSKWVYNEETYFKKAYHRFILEHHAQGATIATIVDELKKAGMPKGRLSVKIIIRKYEMAWNIRKYKPSQLEWNPHRLRKKPSQMILEKELIKMLLRLIQS